MVGINSTMSVIILNVNHFKYINQKMRLSKWIKRQGPTICYNKPTLNIRVSNVKSKGLEKDSSNTTIEKL